MDDILKVYSGTASDTEQEITFDFHPTSIDVFVFNSYDMYICFVSSNNKQSDWMRIPSNFFYSIDSSKISAERKIKSCKVKNYTSGQNAEYQIIIWNNR